MSLKILVPVKRVIDHNIKPRIVSAGASDGASSTCRVETQGVKMSINPFDEIALEEALRLREKGQADEVIAVSIGPQAAQDVLRTAMAMGADRAILVRCDEILEPLSVAKILEKIITQEQPDLVCMGKQAIDDDMNATGQILAAKLGWPQATFASKVTVIENKAEVQRDIDGGTETLRLTLPAIITADLRLNEPRYASLPNIMKARKKPLQIIEAGELGLSLATRLEVIGLSEPPERQAGIIVDSVEKLVTELKTEAKVI